MTFGFVAPGHARPRWIPYVGDVRGRFRNPDAGLSYRGVPSQWTPGEAREIRSHCLGTFACFVKPLRQPSSPDEPGRIAVEEPSQAFANRECTWYSPGSFMVPHTNVCSPRRGARGCGDGNNLAAFYNYSDDAESDRGSAAAGVLQRGSGVATGVSARNGPASTRNGPRGSDREASASHRDDDRFRHRHSRSHARKDRCGHMWPQFFMETVRLRVTMVANGGGPVRRRIVIRRSGLRSQERSRSPSCSEW